ncbi:MAG: nucleotidyltransferase domain-containing protein [Deltaproteobacteria bacterium]|nr:nucleotidyltransferase domain-containing protein [Deltaproteobacteria bacterium]
MAVNSALAIEIPQSVLSDFCRRHRIKKLSFFGSVVKGTAGPQSDLDVLVEFVPEATPGYFGLARVAQELSRLCGGRQVDLRTPQELSRYFRQHVLDTAQVQYAA